MTREHRSDRFWVRKCRECGALDLHSMWGAARLVESDRWHCHECLHHRMLPTQVELPA